MREKVSVLFVVGKLSPGGIERDVLNFCKYLDHETFDCTCLVYGEEIGAWEYKAKEAGAKIARVPIPSKNHIRYYFSMKKLLKNWDYSIVHGQCSFNSGIVMKAAYKCHVPCRISHSHNIEAVDDKKNFIRLIYNKLMRKWMNTYSTSLFACSEDAGNYLFGEKTFQKKGYIVNNGIEVKKYMFDEQIRNLYRKNLALSDNLVVGNIGRICTQKNQIRLMDIFKILLDYKPESILLIVGDGPLKSELIKYSEKLDIKEKVIFLGQRDDVDKLMQAMDIFVLPSLYEGLGIVLIEAQAASLKCVVSDVVPRESNAIGLIDYCSLSETDETWAKKIIEASDNIRIDRKKEIDQSGYDIVDVVDNMQKKYLELLAGK